MTTKNDNYKIDRSELAMWAEGTQYTTDELVRLYAEYRQKEIEAGWQPAHESNWANEVLGIPNE